MRAHSLRAVVFAAAAAAACASASAAEITSYDNGHYRNDGLHSGGNTSNFTGYANAGGAFPTSNEHRAFYAFDLTGAMRASSVSITFLGRGSFVTDTGTETINVNDFTGNVGALVAGSTVINPIGDTFFADLGNGLLGSYTHTAASGTTMPEITIVLSSLFVDQFNAALAGDRRIAVGTALTSGAYFVNQGFWGGTGVVPAARLNVTAEAAAVPEPSTTLLAAAGVIGLWARRRRVK